MAALQASGRLLIAVENRLDVGLGFNDLLLGVAPGSHRLCIRILDDLPTGSAVDGTVTGLPTGRHQLCLLMQPDPPPANQPTAPFACRLVDIK